MFSNCNYFGDIEDCQTFFIFGDCRGWIKRQNLIWILVVLLNGKLAFAFNTSNSGRAKHFKSLSLGGNVKIITIPSTLWSYFSYLLIHKIKAIHKTNT